MKKFYYRVLNSYKDWLCPERHVKVEPRTIHYGRQVYELTKIISHHDVHTATDMQCKIRYMKKDMYMEICEQLFRDGFLVFNTEDDYAYYGVRLTMRLPIATRQ